MGRKVCLDREHQKRHQQADRDPRMHVAGKGKATHQGERTKAVDDVVDVESVARSLAVTDSRECTVERVAQPVQRKAGNDAQQRIAIAGSQGIADSGANLRRQAENGEMVGADP